MAKTRVMGASPKRAAWLYIVNGPDAGRDFRIGEQATIGRNTMECEIILSDSNVSDKHARIKRDGLEFVIFDLASLNGTFVNGQRVQKELLSDDDRIRVGGTELVFKATPKS